MRIVLFSFIVVVFAACGTGKSSFNPDKKYSPQEIQKDYFVFETVLKKTHPGLYWYTPKDSMDYFFRSGAEQLKDSMTEPEFRKVLTYVVAKIDCGHTSVRPSKHYSGYLDTVRAKTFPLSLKLWQDTIAIATNLNRRDSILKRGTVITKINNLSTNFIVDSLFKYLSADGYNRTHKYQTLSNRGAFGQLYTSAFGLSEKYVIGYLDSLGQTKTTVVPVFNPIRDSSNRTFIMPIPRLPKPSRKERKQMQLPVVRSLRIDTANRTAFMDLNSFGRGFHLKKFFRTSFKSLRKNKIEHLVIDVRGNGGGSVTNSTFISRFIANHPFKIADSLYAVTKKNRYGHYIQNNFWNTLFIKFLTKRKSDGHYHFGYFERHYFNPKKHNHFNGKVYVLIGGNSFSATTLFVNAVIRQDNVITVGEETGGGAYGNNAWLIPDVTLPETGVRFRLPLFRLVMSKDIPKNGRGILPEIESGPTVDAIRRGADFKLDKVMELIRADKTK
ncbi:MAG: S41 family peptidase, partial [Chitinophagales bacterium]